MDMGTNTSDIEVRPHRDGTRAPTSDANAQNSLLIVDVMLPSGWEINWQYPKSIYPYWGMNPIH